MTAPSVDYNEACTGFDWRSLVERLYADAPLAKEILLRHSRAVADFAARINTERQLGLDADMIETGAMLHDIGIILTDAPGIGCNGLLPYICHGIAGARLLRLNGAPEYAARIAERHTGAGLTAADIAERQLPLPYDVEMCPRTILEKLICYADKFFSKRPGQIENQKTVEKVRDEMRRHGPSVLERFDRLHRYFTGSANEDLPKSQNL